MSGVFKIALLLGAAQSVKLETQAHSEFWGICWSQGWDRPDTPGYTEKNLEVSSLLLLSTPFRRCT